MRHTLLAEKSSLRNEVLFSSNITLIYLNFFQIYSERFDGLILEVVKIIGQHTYTHGPLKLAKKKLRKAPKDM